jgi:dihydroxy-acid dehydratase
MRYSLISRDLIADSIETMHEGYMADALLTVGGCDKTVPAALMPIPRHNSIGLTLYAGTARPGHCAGCVNAHGGKGLDAKDVMEAIGAVGVGTLGLQGLEVLERAALPGPGTCSAMFTANTMSSAIEALGMAPPGTASRPVVEEGGGGELTAAKRADCREAVRLLMGLLRRGVRARDIITMEVGRLGGWGQ